MKNFKLFALLFFICLQFPVKASHITGGDLVYECIGQDSFLVTLRLFRDCSGVTANPNETVSVVGSCGTVSPFVLNKQAQVIEVSQLCTSWLSSSTCNGGITFGLEVHTYTGIVVLSQGCNDWELVYSTCCRNPSIENVQSLGNVDSYITCTINNSSFVCNTSPQIQNLGSPSVYFGQVAEFNLGAYDPDGDSIVYSLAPAYSAANTSVVYNPNYSSSQPFGGNNTAIDSNTGQLTFIPTSLGLFLVNVQVDEYDKVTKQLKGKIQREFQVLVVSSSQNAPYFQTNAVTNLGDGNLVGEKIIACPGDSLDFSISLFDSNLTDVLAISHNIYSALDSSAIITVTGSNPITMNVKWMAIGSGILNYRIEGSDQTCGVPGMVSKGFQIELGQGVSAGHDQTFCPGGLTSLNGEGIGTLSWSVLTGSAIDTNMNSPNYNFSCMNCLNPEVSPAVSTTYILSSSINGTCGNSDTVNVTVVSSFSLDVTNDTDLCNTDTIQLSAVASPSGLNYQYNWSGVGLSSFNTSQTNVFIDESKTFTVNVSLGACTLTEAVNVYLSSPIPTGFSLSADSIICEGDSTQIVVDFPQSGPQSGLCGLGNSGLVPSDTGYIGTQNNISGNNLYPNHYSRFYWGNKHQIIYTSSELQSMGLSAGDFIKSISFDVAFSGTNNALTNYSIKVGCVSGNVIGTNWHTGLLAVYNSSSYIPVTGWNKHSFTNPYLWDGSSSLVFEICSNNISYQTNGNVTLKYTSTSFNSVNYYRADNLLVCSNTSVTGSSVNRPNTRFEFGQSFDSTSYTYSWENLPGLLNYSDTSALVGPLSSSTYNFIISDSLGGCSDTISQIITVNNTPFDAGFSFDSVMCLTDPSQILNPIVSGGIFTGQGVSSSGVFTPINAGVGTWSINYFITTPALCANDSTEEITVLPIPDASINAMEVCKTGGNVFLSSATPGGIWSGSGIVNSNTGEFAPSNLTPGDYTVSYNLNQTCASSSTATIRVIEPFDFSLVSSSVQLCQGETLDLANLISLSGAPNQGSMPVFDFYESNGYVNVSGVFNAGGVSNGSYGVEVTVSDSLGNCGITKIINVTVNEIEFAEIISDPSFCTSESEAKLFVQPWLFGSGVSFSQTPLGNLGANDSLVIIPFGQNGQFDPTLKGAGQWEIAFEFVNGTGCTGISKDTIYVLTEPSSTVNNNGHTLEATAGMGYQYQWLDCENNNSPIPGATSSTFSPAVAGSFAVEITAGSCSVTSDCYEAEPVGITGISQSSNVMIHPNPVRDKVNITLPYSEKVQVQIIDNVGKTVKTIFASKKEFLLSFDGLSSGVYILRVEGESIFFNERIVKE